IWMCFWWNMQLKFLNRTAHCQQVQIIFRFEMAVVQLIRHYSHIVARYLRMELLAAQHSGKPTHTLYHGLREQLSMTEEFVLFKCTSATRIGRMDRLSDQAPLDSSDRTAMEEILSDLEPIKNFLISTEPFRNFAISLRRTLFADDLAQLRQIQGSILCEFHGV